MRGRPRRLHFSWYLAWLSAAALAGIAAAPKAVDWGFSNGAWLAIAMSLVLAAVIRGTATMIVLIAAGLIVGLWRGSQLSNQLQNYQKFYGQTVTLSGKVAEDTSYGPQGDQRLRLAKVTINKTVMPAAVWVSIPSNTEIKRGDIVTINGLLSKGFGNLPAAVYQARVIDAKRPYPGDVGRRVRDWFAAGIHKAIPEPQASLGVGYLVGQRHSLPEELNEQMRIVGLTHVIIASGYNLTILVNFARRLLARFSKYLTVLVGSILIGSFILVTGMSPSMSRAGLVTGLALAAWYYGRAVHPLVLLPFAAAITAMVNPSYIWGDIGWYLSFAAFAGVLVLAPLLNSFFWGQKVRPGALREIFIATTSAQIATMPIVMFVFGHYSVYALPANLLVLPLVPFAMMLTFIAGLGGVLIPVLSVWLAAPATVLLQYNTAVVSWMANLPGAQGELSLGIYGLTAGYTLIVLSCIILWRKTRHNFRRQYVL